MIEKMPLISKKLAGFFIICTVFLIFGCDNEAQGQIRVLYKPVVIIHGIFDHKYTLYSLRDRIIEKHNGTEVFILDKLHGWKSMAPMWYQVNTFQQLLTPIMEQYPQGIHLIGFSQGGLVARAMIQTIKNHNVHTFISLSSPQGGQFGDDFLTILFPGVVKDQVWRIFYRKRGQLVSVANYWRDPYHLNQFYAQSVFLPKIDNEGPYQNVQQFKDNFVKLKKVVLIGGPDDGVISPWQSSQFGCYDENENITEMRSRDIYKKDLFGLKSLDERGQLVEITVPGIQHLNWHRNLTVIDEHILPHLI